MISQDDIDAFHQSAARCHGATSSLGFCEIMQSLRMAYGGLSEISGNVFQWFDEKGNLRTAWYHRASSAQMDRAGTVRPLIASLKGHGMSLRAIAAELNARNVKTARGGDWHAMTVRNALQRAA